MTVRAAPRNVRLSGTGNPLCGSGEESGLPAGMPEQYPVGVRECPGADVRDQAGHGLGGVGVIDDRAFPPHGELEGFPRCRRRHAVAVTDEGVVNLDDRT